MEITGTLSLSESDFDALKRTSHEDPHWSGLGPERRQYKIQRTGNDEDGNRTLKVVWLAGGQRQNLHLGLLEHGQVYYRLSTKQFVRSSIGFGIGSALSVLLTYCIGTYLGGNVSWSLTTGFVAVCASYPFMAFLVIRFCATWAARTTIRQLLKEREY